MNDFKSLLFLDRVRTIFERFGVNYLIMRKIIRAKLTMDRRQKTMTSAKGKEVNNYSSYIASAVIIGGFSLLIMVSHLPFMYRYAVVLGVSIFMVALNLISDFSSVLLDTKEKELLGSKPIDNTTLNAARFMHILIYLTTISACYSGPSILGSFYKDGVLIGLIYILLIIISVILIIVFTGIIYTVLLRYSSGEKIKNLINGFQILLSIISILAYQFIRFAFDINCNLMFTYKWWNIFIPSIVLASPLYIIKTGMFNAYTIIYTIITILLPIIAVFGYVKVILPYFERNLYKMNMVDKDKRQKKAKWISYVGNIVCRDKQERAIFRYTSNMIDSDRRFKQSIYPSLSIACVFPLIILFSVIAVEGTEMLQNTGENYAFHLSLYFGGMMLINIISLLGYSEKYKGAWIFKMLPIEDEKIIKRGAFKCFLIRFTYPILVIYSIMFTILSGISILIDIIPVFMIVTSASLIIYNKYYDGSPFSRGYNTVNAGKNFGGTLIVTTIIIALSIFHRLLKFFDYGVMIYAAITTVITVILWYNSLVKEK